MGPHRWKHLPSHGWDRGEHTLVQESHQDVGLLEVPVLVNGLEVPVLGWPYLDALSPNDRRPTLCPSGLFSTLESCVAAPTRGVKERKKEKEKSKFPL